MYLYLKSTIYLINDRERVIFDVFMQKVVKETPHGSTHGALFS
jgi:hypothetical protein